MCRQKLHQKRCDAPFTTGRIVDRLLAVVPQEFQTDATDLSWVRLCPDCRHLTEGEKVAQEGIMSRWPVVGLHRSLKKASAQGHGPRGLAPRADARRKSAKEGRFLIGAGAAGQTGLETNLRWDVLRVKLG